jgi:hypothetical protein
MEPISQERLEAFWKGCDNPFIEVNCDCEGGYRKSGQLCYRCDGKACITVSPPLTLDNLFRYAVPTKKIREIEFTFHRDYTTCHVDNYDDYQDVEADTPALALFLALEKLKQ